MTELGQYDQPNDWQGMGFGPEIPSSPLHSKTTTTSSTTTILGELRSESSVRAWMMRKVQALYLLLASPLFELQLSSDSRWSGIYITRCIYNVRCPHFAPHIPDRPTVSMNLHKYRRSYSPWAESRCSTQNGGSYPDIIAGLITSARPTG